MKNNILIFLLGVFVTISIAATVPNTGLLTVKPAIPKSVIIKPIRTMSGIEIIITNYVKSMVSQGYIVKSISIIDDENFSKGVVVMEKY
jgi:hypothetical protein